MRCDYCGNVTIDSNNITLATAAIGSSAMENSSIINNEVSSSSQGIFLILDCRYNNVTNNTAYGHNTGIYLRDINNHTFVNNTVYGSATGIYVYNSSEMEFYNDTVYGNGYDVDVRNTGAGAATVKISRITFRNPSGTLENYTRSEMQALIEQYGGKVSSSVSAKTDYLVAGNNPGSKIDKARQLNVKIIGEAEILALIGR